MFPTFLNKKFAAPTLLIHAIIIKNGLPVLQKGYMQCRDGVNLTKTKKPVASLTF